MADGKADDEEDGSKSAEQQQSKDRLASSRPNLKLLTEIIEFEAMTV